jgi:hypothetical protein
MTKPKKTPQKVNVHELLDRFAAKEEAFLRKEFLSPSLRGGTVRVRIGGVVCKIGIQPGDFEGWGVFQPTSFKQAHLVREATLMERKQYLELFPRVHLLMCRRAGTGWLGCAANLGDQRFRIQGLVPVRLSRDVQQFDTIVSRYDGSCFWFDEIDMRRDPAAAACLRSALSDVLSPEKLERRGLTAEERAAYEVNYWGTMYPDLNQIIKERRNSLDARRSPIGQSGEASRPQAETVDPIRERLRNSLSHAGAELLEYLERSDSFRVTYDIGGQKYTSSVDKRDFSVQVAGICLEDKDRQFDLTSLVGVLREGERGHQIYRMNGDPSQEEDYYD